MSKKNIATKTTNIIEKKRSAIKLKLNLFLTNN